MKIGWSDPSVLDLESIRDYIAKDSEYYASEFIGKILDAVDTLKDLPKIGRPVPECAQDEIRELLFHNYRLIYRIETERILILAIVHGARDLSNLKPKPWEIV